MLGEIIMQLVSRSDSPSSYSHGDLGVHTDRAVR